MPEIDIPCRKSTSRTRFTKDLDLLVRRSPENARRLLSALDAFGFGSVGLTEDDFLGPEQIVQLGAPPDRVDLITPIAGVSFDDAWEGRVAGRYGEQPVFYLPETSQAARGPSPRRHSCQSSSTSRHADG